MTRKDYELIANALREQRGVEPLPGGKVGIDHAAEKLAAKLRAENPSFDTGRFLKACGAR